MYFAQFEVLAVVGGLTLALAHAAQHGGVPTAARQLAAEDTPHATRDAPDTVHADAFFGSQHRGGVQTVMSNPHDASDVSHAFINASVQTASQMDEPTPTVGGDCTDAEGRRLPEVTAPTLQRASTWR